MTDDAASRMPHPAPDWDALARFHAGESPDAEARALREWLAAHPADAAMLAALHASVDRGAAAPAFDEAGVDVEAALRRVKARRDAAPAGRRATPVVPLRPREAAHDVPRRGARRAWWATAGLAAAAAAAFFIVSDAPRDTATTASGARVAAAGSIAVTAVGVRDSVRLPDGTRVVLAPGSRLEVAAGYGRGARDVALEGVALFSVEHDAARPFTVRAGDVVIRDLGTVFTVRADAAVGAPGRLAGTVAVSVTEGVVGMRAASATDTGIVLAAGDHGAMRGDRVVDLSRGTVVPGDVAWASGTIVYRAAPLAMVAADLRRWYGIDLRIDDPTLAARRLTATFTEPGTGASAGDSADQVLRVLGLALGAEVVREGAVARLRPSPGTVP
jgi:transmembrane sensor